MRIFWPDQVTNEGLWKPTKRPRVDLRIRKRKWGWLSHTLQKPSDDIARQALEWNPQGKQGRGRPTNTWRRTELNEAKRVKKTWTEIKTDAKNRVRRRILVEALRSAAEWQDVIYTEGAKKMYTHFKKGEFDCPTCRMVTLAFIWLTPSFERTSYYTLLP